MKLTDREVKLVMAGFINGYHNGHNDTVEGFRRDTEDAALDWVNDAVEDGGLEYTFDQLQDD